MDEYECLDQYFNPNEDELVYSDFSAQTSTNSVVITSAPNYNFQCNPPQNDHQALPQQLNNNGFIGAFDRDLYPVQHNYNTNNNQGMNRGDVLNYPLSNFATSNELQSLSQASSVSSDQCNGTGKPRVRARRGQATDPHSIAERLRREKISDRMKNLQELLPNPNKTDKSSMLDEIIEYVKFLQLQIEELSMSRHGSTDTVMPLARDDSQAEGCGEKKLLISTSIAFERELAKLMDQSNAAQLLHSKGLSLLSLPLAFAISANRGTHNDAEFNKNV